MSGWAAGERCLVKDQDHGWATAVVTGSQGIGSQATLKLRLDDGGVLIEKQGSDVERLTELLHRLVDKGHTVLVIEHHLDLIKDADYIVEIGPNGGDAGGELLYQGALSGLKKKKRSVVCVIIIRINKNTRS